MIQRAALTSCLFILGCSKPNGLVVPPLTFALGSHWQPTRLQAPLVGERVLVLNEDDDSMGIYQGTSERTRVPTGLHPLNHEAPRSVAFVPGEDHYTVLLASDASRDASGPHANRDSPGPQNGYLVDYRVGDHTLLRSQRIVSFAESMRATRTLFVIAQFDLGPLFRFFGNPGAVESDKYANVLLVDRETLLQEALVPACTGPRAVTIARDEHTAFVSCFADEVVAISLDPPYELVARLRVGTEPGTPFSPFYKPQGIAASPIADDVWVSNGNSLDLRVFNGRTFSWDDARTMTLATTPDGLSFAHDGSRLFAVLEDRVLVVEPMSAVVLQTIPLPPCIAPRTLAVSTDDRTGYLACDADLDREDSLLVLDLAQGMVVDVIPAGHKPTFAAVIAP